LSARRLRPLHTQGHLTLTSEDVPLGIQGSPSKRIFPLSSQCPGADLYQPAETLTHARMLRVRAKLPYPIGPPDVFAMAVSVVARAA
jgi:hypothetical protein